VSVRVLRAVLPAESDMLATSFSLSLRACLNLFFALRVNLTTTRALPAAPKVRFPRATTQRPVT
jgi:hypothetical protein